MFLIPELNQSIYTKIVSSVLDFANKRIGKVVILTENPKFKVSSQLKQTFSRSTFSVVTPPYNRNDIVGLSDDIVDSKIILIGISNLIHYDKRLSPGFISYPQQLHRMLKENALIRALTRTSAAETKRVIDLKPRLVQSKQVVLALSKIANHLGYAGTVLEYTDSKNFMKSGIDRYVIDTKPINKLTSFIGIGFKKKSNSKRLSDLEINILLATIKSMHIRNICRKKYQLALPAFHLFHSIKNGVFVRIGTKRGKTFNPSCSRGFIENGVNSSADGFISALKSCECDNSSRWRTPMHRKSVEVKYRVEMLQSKRSWRLVSGSRIASLIKLDGTCGLKLNLDSGKSALFLPHESKHFWNKQQMLNHLLTQAGGTEADLAYATAELFRSVIYEN